MRLPTEDETKKGPGQLIIGDESHVSQADPSNDENQTSILLESNPTQGPDHLSFVARATNDAVRDWDVKTNRLTWPQGFPEWLGHTPEEGQDQLGFWQKNLHPDDRVRTAAAIRDALVGSGQHWSGEYRFRRADGSYAHLLERALILRDHTGAAVRFIGSLMDITTRKQLHDQLCRSQKMEAFGQLATGVAHDFNNFLTTILGYSDLLLHQLRVKGQVAGHISEIRNAAGRASTLTQQLLAFSRRQPLEPKVVEVNSTIANLERSLLPLLGANIGVVCHFHNQKQKAHIKVDPGQLTQIIVNLAVNARDAMPGGGRLTLETGTVTVQKSNQSFPGADDLPPGNYVLIGVTDNGIGMSDDVKAHLFEPFFTTKDGRSGLGLATSYGIVRQSGGQIRVQSQEGKGTTVQIYLPKVPAPPASSYKKPVNRKLPGGKETILVLEDEISVRHMSVRLLRKLGYDVIEAANSDDAQRLIAERAGRKIDLLLTDMVMPQMSGRRFADWLRAASPQIKVVFASGYLEESLHPGDRPDSDMFFLAKPFDSAQLAGKVREALDS
jgi:two-component system, cell cycle sensor histidine kinase and response regulator CckA